MSLVKAGLNSVTIVEIKADFPLCCRYIEIDIRCQLESILIVQTLAGADSPAPAHQTRILFSLTDLQRTGEDVSARGCVL